MTELEPRLCRDCRYADLGPPEPVCVHASSVVEYRVDLATNRPMTPYTMTCRGARQSVSGHCDIDGRFWEAAIVGHRAVGPLTSQPFVART